MATQTSANTLREQILSGLGWTGLVQSWRLILQFGISILLARLLVPSDFGLIGMVMVFASFVSIFNDLGLGAAIIQQRKIDDIQISTVFWLTLAIGVVLTTTMALSAPLLARFFHQPLLRILTPVLALNILFASWSIIPATLLQRSMLFRKIAIIEITGITIAGLVAFIMALSGFGVWCLVLQTLLGTLIPAVLFWLAARTEWRSFNLFSIRMLFKFGSNLMGFQIINYWIRNMDNLLIGRFIGSEGLGLYSRAYNLMLFPVSQMSGIVARVMFPALSSIQDDRQQVRNIYLKSTRAIALIIFPLMVGLLVTATPFITTLFGPKWNGVIPVLRVFCVMGLGQSISTTVGWIYTSQGRVDLMFKWSLFSGAVSIGSIFIGLQWGIIGVAVAYTISGYLILWYPGWEIPGRLIGIHFTDMMKNLAGPFFAASSMGGAMWLLGLVLPLQLDGWPRLLILTVSGCILYYAAIRFFCLEAYREMLSLINERFLSPHFSKERN